MTKEKASNNGEGKGGGRYSCRAYSLALVQPYQVDQNKNRCIVHFIILTLKTSVEIIARKDKGKGDKDRMRGKHVSHTVNFIKELFINNFLN